MSKETSTAFHLAENLFYGFRGETDLFTTEEIDASGVVERAGHMTNVEGIVSWGSVDGKKVSQRLSLGKQGLYYFTTTEHPPFAGVEKVHISPNSDKGLAELEKSTLVSAMNSILSARSRAR